MWRATSATGSADGLLRPLFNTCILGGYVLVRPAHLGETQAVRDQPGCARCDSAEDGRGRALVDQRRQRQPIEWLFHHVVAGIDEHRNDVRVQRQRDLPDPP